MPERLIFLHGFLGNRSDWDEVRSFIDVPTIAIDLPGHGLAPFRADVLKSLRETISDSDHLVGYSMGGRLALQYSRRYPVQKLTLISTHLGLRTEQEKKLRLAQDAQLALEILQMPIDQFLKRWYDQPLFRTFGDRAKLRRKQNCEGLSLALQEFSLGHQLYEGVPDARFILGELDETYRNMYDKIPHELVQGAGHALHMEKPFELARLLCQ